MWLLSRHCMVFAICALCALVSQVARPSETEPEREELEAMAEAGRAMLLQQRPGLATELDALPGYAVIAMSATKVPAVGAGLGYGVIVDNRTRRRSYIRVTQLELGGGIGARKYKLVILLKEAALVERLVKGGIHYESSAELGASSSAEKGESTLSTHSGRGYKVFKLTESGALATITIRILRATPYLDD